METASGSFSAGWRQNRVRLVILVWRYAAGLKCPKLGLGSFGKRGARPDHRSGLKVVADYGEADLIGDSNSPPLPQDPVTRHFSFRLIHLHLFRFLPRSTIGIGKSCAHTPSFRHRHQPVRSAGPRPRESPFYQTNLIPISDTLSRSIPPTQNYQTNPIFPPTSRKRTRCRFPTEPNSVSQANCRAHAGWVVRQRRLIKTAS